jgi:choline transport protein
MELNTYKTNAELDVAERGSSHGEKAGVSPSSAPSGHRSGTQLEVCMNCALLSNDPINTT